MYNCTSSPSSCVSPLSLAQLPGYVDSDSGNYEGFIVMGPSDYATPALIRNTLNSGPPTFKRATETKLPSGYRAARCQITGVTNWAFPSFEELAIPRCEQVVHLPHKDCTTCYCDLAVVFKPKKGKIAAVYFTRAVDAAGIEAECPVGDKFTTAKAYGEKK